ncbi:nitroreductase family protein [Lentibacillus amyloliquefaciens]|uniref:nitroreductase family protein n=1 Tax=Lentibacillus amyloliquefaciens TaxID=1472767 RepID=UPI0009ECB534
MKKCEIQTGFALFNFSHNLVTFDLIFSLHSAMAIYYCPRKEAREKFHSFIMDGNRTWCEKAPVLALIISDKQDNTHAFDTGAAWGYLSLQAAKSGVATHAMGGFYKDKAREVPVDPHLSFLIPLKS